MVFDQVNAIGVMYSQEAEVGIATKGQSSKRAKTGANPETSKSTGPKSATATEAGRTKKERKVKYSFLRLMCCRRSLMPTASSRGGKDVFRNVGFGGIAVEPR